MALVDISKNLPTGYTLLKEQSYLSLIPSSEVISKLARYSDVIQRKLHH
jgi:hypothetical protein